MRTPEFRSFWNAEQIWRWHISDSLNHTRPPYGYTSHVCPVCKWGGKEVEVESLKTFLKLPLRSASFLCLNHWRRRGSLSIFKQTLDKYSWKCGVKNSAILLAAIKTSTWKWRGSVSIIERKWSLAVPFMSMFNLDRNSILSSSNILFPSSTRTVCF